MPILIPGLGKVTVIQTKIQSADGNTKVQTEESAAENKIRFDTNGVERALIESTGEFILKYGIADADKDTKIQVEESADDDKIRMDVKAVEAFLLHDDGILDLAKQSRVLAHKQADTQTITTGTHTKIVLDAEDFDEQGEFDPTTNYRFTAKKAGYYLVIGRIMYIPAVADKEYRAEIYLNGAVTRYDCVHSSITNRVHASVTAIIQLAADDYIELYAYHEAGVDAVVGKYITSTHLAIHKLS